MIRLKRAYDEPESADGVRILVDRLWPRGLTKGKAAIDVWMREIAPSDGLRKWFSHEASGWEGFRESYRKELEGKRDLLEAIRQAERERGTVTLVYSARDTERNNAAVLREALEG
jgi:uncharacterized protein YeaO (DUF488 family)